MRACVDNVTLDSRPGRGTVVTMRKHIRWSDDAPLRRLRAASLPLACSLAPRINFLRADRGHYLSRVAG